MEAKLRVFNILVKSLAHNDKQFDDKYLAVILLNLLPNSHENITNAIKYTKNALTQLIVTKCSEISIRG